MKRIDRLAGAVPAVLAAAVLLAAAAASAGALPMGSWPEGMIFPLFHGNRHAGLEAASLDVQPHYWWCTIRNTVFRVEGGATVTTGRSGDLAGGLPLMIHELYESHESFLYPQLTIDGTPASPLLVYNPDHFVIGETGVFYDGSQIARSLHPWLEAAVPMDQAAPEAYLRGYELFWLFVLESERAGEQHTIEFQYGHNETELGGWENRMDFHLGYGRTWKSAGPFHAELHPDHGFDWIHAPYLDLTHPDGAFHLDGDTYLEPIEMRISTSDIEPSAATLAPGETVQFEPWAAFVDLGFTWHQADPAVGELAGDGTYTALAPGYDEVWLVAEMYGETAHAPVAVTIYPTPVPTPAATWPPAPTPTPADLYRLILNDDEFHPGDRFRLYHWIENQESYSLEVTEFLLLDVYGEYYFWPSWSAGLDYQSWTIEPDSIYVDLLLGFTWPEGAGWAAGLTFWGALTDPALTVIYFLGQVTFGFGE